MISKCFTRTWTPEGLGAFLQELVHDVSRSTWSCLSVTCGYAL
jgi:hypothetical protein